MVDDLIQEIAVVGDDHHTAIKRCQVFFQDIKGEDIEIIGRLVEDKEIRMLHQHCNEIKPSFFPAA